MAKVTIEIDTDNAAFEDDNWGHEVSRILKTTAMKSLRYGREISGVLLRDSNGNTVGSVTIGEEAGDPELDTTPDQAQDVIALAGLVVPVEDIKKWSQEEIDRAVEWAGAVHLDASDNDVDVPPKPEFLNNYPERGYDDFMDGVD